MPKYTHHGPEMWSANLAWFGRDVTAFCVDMGLSKDFVENRDAHPTWPKDGIGILSYQVQVLLRNPKVEKLANGWTSWPGLSVL